MFKIINPINTVISIGNVLVFFGENSQLPVAIEVESNEKDQRFLHVCEEGREHPGVKGRYPIVLHKSPEDINKRLITLMGLKVTQK